MNKILYEISICLQENVSTVCLRRGLLCILWKLDMQICLWILMVIEEILPNSFLLNEKTMTKTKILSRWLGSKGQIMQTPTAFVIVQFCMWNMFSISKKNEHMKDVVSVILQIFILLIRVEENIFPCIYLFFSYFQSQFFVCFVCSMERLYTIMPC